jgi:hypothetical protein
MNNQISVDRFKFERSRIVSLGQAGILADWYEKLCFWELLLIIGHLNGDINYGVNDYIDMIKTRNVTRLTVNRFIRSRIEAGDLIEVESAKKSRKTLILSPEIIADLDMYFKDFSKT